MRFARGPDDDVKTMNAESIDELKTQTLVQRWQQEAAAGKEYHSHDEAVDRCQR